MRFARKACLLAAVIAVSMSGQLAVCQDSSEGTRAQTFPRLPDPKSAPQADSDNRPLVNPAAQPDAVIMNSRAFGIPFNVDAAGRQPVEVQLLVSRGDAKWQLLDRQPPGVRQFKFIGKDDGLFWFATRTIDSSGQPFPGGPLKPQLKVFIDTTKPDVNLGAEADASGRVDVTLQLNDATPAKNIRLHYVTDRVREWQIVDVKTLMATGKVSFVPNHQWQKLSLQTIVIDSAGNQTIQSRLIQRPRIAEAVSPHLAMTPVAPTANPFTDKATATTTESTKAKLVQTTGQVKPTLPGYRVESSSNTGLPMRGMTAEATPRGLRVSSPANSPFGPPSLQGNRAAYPAPNYPTRAVAEPTLPDPATADEISAFSLNAPGPTSGPQTLTAKSEKPKKPRPRTPAEAMKPLSEASAVDSVTGSPAKDDQAPPASTDKQDDSYKARRLSEEQFDDAIANGRVPVRYSDSERFSLSYTLEAIGANGVNAVELYGSLNGGKTWGLWGADPDRNTPFDIETKDEGVFSYRVVVVSRNGLASPRPLAGDAPDIVVVVDKTIPTVRITSARYGVGDRTGSLVIGYEAIDANLMKRPISLSFSDSINGPWTTIAAGLRNDGIYVWPADPQMPRQIYLRIDVKDKAGNIGTYVLDEPIETQGLAPRARILGFESLSGNEPATGDGQTAKRPRAAFK